jgi:hypothetical protein
LPKEERTLYIMPDRLPYISLIDKDAQVNLKRGMRIDILGCCCFEERIKEMKP